MTCLKTFPGPLSAEEEKYYIDLLENGDPAARNILIERNLRLVAHIVKKYHQGDREVEDLLSIGTVGLIKAIDTYSVAKGNKLSTYAARCIENAILSRMRFWWGTSISKIKSKHRKSRCSNYAKVCSPAFFLDIDSMTASSNCTFCSEGQFNVLIY